MRKAATVISAILAAVILWLLIAFPSFVEESDSLTTELRLFVVDMGTICGVESLDHLFCKTEKFKRS